MNLPLEIPCGVKWCVAAADLPSPLCKIHRVQGDRFHPRELTAMERAEQAAKEVDPLAEVRA